MNEQFFSWKSHANHMQIALLQMWPAGIIYAWNYLDDVLIGNACKCGQRNAKVHFVRGGSAKQEK